MAVTVDSKFLKQTPFAEGGEGTIYEYGNGQLIKVYKPHVNLASKRKKIEYLMSVRLPSAVVLPLDIVTKDGKFIGYAMNKVSGEEVKLLSKKKHVKANKISYKDILKVLVGIKAVLKELHTKGIYVADLNDANILYDTNFDVHFIDCDSWAMGGEICDVAMESFKDPTLVGAGFSDKTDAYSYAVLAFKSLTKIHPFGGTMNPDIDILERMAGGVTVIDNPNVIIPKTIPPWNYIPPKLLADMKSIFTTKDRFLIDRVDEFYGNMKQCAVDGNYYYSKFTTCPFCDLMAKVIDKPQKLETASAGVVPILYFSGNDVRIILSDDVYVSDNGYAVHIPSGLQTPLHKGNRYYFAESEKIVFSAQDNKVYVSRATGSFSIPKVNKSMVSVCGNRLYYIGLDCNLTELLVTEKGNSTRIVTKCSFNSFFKVHDPDTYMIVNVYDGMKIVNISGYNYEIRSKSKIDGYGMHYDEVTKTWLLVLGDTKGRFVTYVFDKNKVIFQSDTIKYTSDLANICYNNGTIFTPQDGVIRGFSHAKNLYKDFPCSAVDEDSKLVRKGKKFLIINEKEMYTFG